MIGDNICHQCGCLGGCAAKKLSPVGCVTFYFIKGYCAWRKFLYAVERVILMAKGDKVLSSGEVAQICHVAPRTAQKWIDEGLLKGYRIPGSRDRRVPVDEMVRFLKKHNMPLPPELIKRCNK